MAAKLKYLLRRPVKLANDLLGWLTSEGSWKLRWPTGEIVDHVISTLPDADAQKVRQQLAGPFFQSWFNNGRINPVYHYNLDPSTLLEGDEFKDASFRVDLIVDGKTLKSNFTVHNGRFFSVELPKPFAFFDGKDLKLGAVSRGDSRDSYVRAIDRKEHGSGEE